ncbi:pyridoxamine 5'-phosphate oxidase [Mariprofundus micogutta]|uniref:Pyridoxamine 5'-phosphate oxidase n=1 Tax=Mariprofundus micogutta TaxID=1921010 RepID=A0A1L8CQQ5_9PROT|nr:CREG family protein [Mariprofundus micogutta]GAV21149.1 pyridoxamine 5'-phosphate oxidase [Mariprofundus micogutta]
MRIDTPSDQSDVSDHWQQDIQLLLNRSRVSFLATQGQAGPEVSMAPFAFHHGKILLHLSRLAKHTINIERSPNIGLMICTPESQADSPLALPRLSLQGEINLVSDDQLESAKAVYLEKIPDAEPLFSFGDFRLFQFSPTHINWVGGFGKARKVSLKQWSMMH